MEEFYSQVMFTFAEGILITMKSTRPIIHHFHINNFNGARNRHSIKFESDASPYIKFSACKRRISEWYFIALRTEIERLDVLMKATESLMPNALSSLIFDFVGFSEDFQLKRYSKIASKMDRRRSSLATLIAFKRVMRNEGEEVIHRNRFIMHL